MQVILLERIAKLGQMGDVVDVKPGYARNFLLPQGKAKSASEANIAAFESEKAKLEAQLAEEAEANALIDAELAAVQFKARDIGEGVPLEAPRVVHVKELCVPQSPKLLTKSRIRASFGGQH